MQRLGGAREGRWEGIRGGKRGGGRGRRRKRKEEEEEGGGRGVDRE